MDLEVTNVIKRIFFTILLHKLYAPKSPALSYPTLKLSSCKE